MISEARFAEQREQMVVQQIEHRHIIDERVLAAMRKVPRHKFIPKDRQRFAYDDRPVEIGERQTISQPYIVALMTQMLHLQGHERVLEVGTGSGYQAAILGELAAEVFTVERHQPLAQSAATLLAKLGYKNVHVHCGDGSKGWPEYAPYHAILVTASAPKVPQPLLEQMATGGCLILPVGGFGSQYLQRWEHTPQGYQHDDLVPVSFVPLIGRHGFDENTW
jgi:protein-L-isoaspartate(D-aspartate) O-methyltransferase